MKKGKIWMPLYIGDYLVDTTTLTTQQHGAYLLLLMHYWVNGPPKDDNSELAAITKCSQKVWQMVRQKVAHFFEIKDGKWFHKRVDEEKENTLQLIEMYKERSKKGNEAKRLKGSLEGGHQGKQKDSFKVPPSPSPTQTPLKTKSKTTSLATKELPAWLKTDVWESWVQHRIDCKKPLTERAAQLCIEKLEDFRQQGSDPESVINQSIIGQYTGLFPVKNQQQFNKSKSYSDANKEYADALTGNHGQQGFVIDYD